MNVPPSLLVLYVFHAIFSTRRRIMKSYPYHLQPLRVMYMTIKKKLCLIPVCSWSTEQDLKNLPYEVEKSIKRLDCRSRGVSTWHDVGRKFNIPDEDLGQVELEYERRGSPMKSLIDILHTKHSTRLRELVTILLELGRIDIADDICSFYIRNQGLATIQNESNSSIESAES